MMNGLTHGCGQCMPCRISKRRVWAHRIMLEALVHPGASFVTLTYADEYIPDGGSLAPRDVQLFTKRLRRLFDPIRLRHFTVGEYGDDTERPHYHMALFGVDRSCADAVRDTWAMGHTMVGDLTMQSAQYIAGYVTKKMTDKLDERLCGRYPEFARMSNRPGIGALSVDVLASALRSPAGEREILLAGDVPSVLRHGSKVLPLGRFMKQKLREELEVTDGAEVSAEKAAAELFTLYENAFLTENRPLSFKHFLEGKWKQKIKNLEKKALIYKQRKTI